MHKNGGEEIWVKRNPCGNANEWYIPQQLRPEFAAWRQKHTTGSLKRHDVLCTLQKKSANGSAHRITEHQDVKNPWTRVSLEPTFWQADLSLSKQQLHPQCIKLHPGTVPLGCCIDKDRSTCQKVRPSDTPVQDFFISSRGRSLQASIFPLLSAFFH